MDLEHLTKHQIVLLTLLVSFVTSIATGIVTVSLMDQAPEGVTRVVNQIVERTVETVVPQAQEAAVAAAPIPQTVVVNNDALAAESIAKVQKSIIRIVERGEDALIARGVMISGNTALTDQAALRDAGTSRFEAILPSGERVPLTYSSDDSDSAIAEVMLETGTSSGYAPAPLAQPGKLLLGQSVIRIGGGGADTVGMGVIATLPSSTGGNTQEVHASITSATPGSVLITLYGEVIGMTTSATAAAGGEVYIVPTRQSGATSNQSATNT